MMTVGELIEILERWPADAPVMVTDSEAADNVNIREVFRSVGGAAIIET